MKGITRALFVTTQIAALFWVTVSYVIAVSATVRLGQPFPVAELSQQAITLTNADVSPIREDLLGYFVAALPARQEDVDGDDIAETVHDFARADIGPHTYELAPREFNIPELPFELAFAERKYIQVFYQNGPLTGAEITVTDENGSETIYHTDSHGWISGLPIETLRSGFTAAYSPDGQNLYRMYYLVEDYEYFTVHFFKAHISSWVMYSLVVWPAASLALLT